MPDLTAEEKEGYIQQNLTILEEHFIPAYENLANGLTALKGTGLYEGASAPIRKAKNTTSIWYIPTAAPPIPA